VKSIEFTDRYEALGIPYPGPATVCEGHCEGVGSYPEHDITSPLWQAAHAQPHDEPCNGWHFVKCPDCGGTGKR
jgi:hypothetical protein